MRAKVIYTISKDEYKELKTEEFYGCETLEEYLRELMIEDSDYVLDAETEIIIE